MLGTDTKACIPESVICWQLDKCSSSKQEQYSMICSTAKSVTWEHPEISSSSMPRQNCAIYDIPVSVMGHVWILFTADDRRRRHPALGAVEILEAKEVVPESGVSAENV
jgi:hypothetical protein